MSTSRRLMSIGRSAAAPRYSCASSSQATIIRQRVAGTGTSYSPMSALHCSRRALHSTVRLLQGFDRSTSNQSHPTGGAGGGARLSVVRPDLALEWAPELNEDVDVSHVECQSKTAVWWRCSSCGNAFRATVVERVESDKGCPDCTADLTRQGTSEHGTNDDSHDDLSTSGDGSISPTGVAAAARASSFAATHPHLVVHWHPTKNGSVRPQDVTSDSHAMAWWTVTAAAVANEGGAVKTTTMPAPVEVFSESIVRFVADPRPPTQKRSDAAHVEHSVVRALAEAAQAPFVPLVNATYQWTTEDTLTTLAHLHYVSRKLPRGDPLETKVDAESAFPRQPISSTEEALRKKALSFIVHKVMDGRMGGLQPVLAPLSEESMERVIGGGSETAPRPLPSYAFIASEAEAVEDAKWKKYFTLAPQEAALAWNIRAEARHQASNATVDHSLTSSPTPDVDAQQQLQSPDREVEEASRLGRERSAPASPAVPYPRMPPNFSTAVPAEHPDDRTLSPRRVQRHRSARSATQSQQGLTAHQRDEDGGRESFGKYDERLLDENDAMSLYDDVSSGGGVDALFSEDALKDQQYLRQPSERGRRGAAVPRRPRHFEMKMPSELLDGVRDAGSTSVVPPSPPPAAIPNAPRVLARSSRRRSETTTSPSGDDSGGEGSARN